jgi:hypothetical protein
VGNDGKGHTKVTRVWAISRSAGGWMVQQPGTVPANTLWFERTVKLVRSRTLVIYVRERVKAPDLATAEMLWSVPVASLTLAAQDSGLDFPPPPKDPQNGCDWTIPTERDNTSCGKSPTGSEPVG